MKFNLDKNSIEKIQHLKKARHREVRGLVLVGTIYYHVNKMFNSLKKIKL